MTTWTRSDTVALAHAQCAHCHGVGLRLGRRGSMKPCNCVLRRIFRICFRRFQELESRERHISRMNFDPLRPGRSGPCVWGRKEEEYCADFYLVSKRILTDDEWNVFRFHFLLGGDWRICCRRLGLDRSLFFHAVYRVEQRLGRVFRELEPYPLFPLEDYFGGVARLAPAIIPGIPCRVIPIRPPAFREIGLDSTADGEAA